MFICKYKIINWAFTFYLLYIIVRFVYEFYQTFKEEIIASRKGYNMDVLFNKVGIDNFLVLNTLCYEYYI